MQRAANFLPTLTWIVELFHYFGVFEFLQVILDVKTLHEALVFQLQLDSCIHEVIIAANVSTWERSCVCFVDTGLEVFGVRIKSTWL